MKYLNKRVFIIPMLLVGIIKNYNTRTNEYYVTFGTRGDVGDWFNKDDLRLWNKKIVELCKFNRKCWRVWGRKLE